MSFDKNAFIKNMLYIEARSDFVANRWLEIVNWHNKKNSKKGFFSKLSNKITLRYFTIFSLNKPKK